VFCLMSFVVPRSFYVKYAGA